MRKGIHFNSHKKRKFSFEQIDKVLNSIDKQRILAVRKMNKAEKSNKEISKEINEYFYSPEKYFQKNSPVTVGKKIYLLDMDDQRLRRGNKLKTEKKITPHFFNNLTNFSNKMKIYNNYIKNMSDKMKGKINYLKMTSKFEIIDNDKLKMIFDSYKIKNHKDDSINDKSQNSNMSDIYKNSLKDKNNFSKKKNSTFCAENVPKEVRKILSLQNKKLNLQKLSEKENSRISKYLSKRLNTTQNSLLLNNVDSFRYKKEVINEIENNKPLDEKYGKFEWNISLRRPDHFQGVRDSYINLKDNRFMPFWSVVVERSPKIKELSIRPRQTFTENNENRKQNYSLSFGNKNQYYKTVDNLGDLSVEGRNLYNLEYKREIIDSTNRKILHKGFFDNGKIISKTEINNLYGHNTFYRNYAGLNLKNNIRLYKRNNFRNENESFN